jgi:hypothetical protein
MLQEFRIPIDIANSVIILILSEATEYRCQLKLEWAEQTCKIVFELVQINANERAIFLPVLAGS